MRVGSILLVSLALATSCSDRIESGGSGPTTSTPGTTPPATVTSTTVVESTDPTVTTATTSATTGQTTATTALPSASWADRPEPPDGISAQIANFIGGNGDICFDAPPPPFVYVDKGPQAEIGDNATVCFGGFGSDAAVEASVTSPTGSVEVWAPRIGGANASRNITTWYPPIGSPLGDYQVIVTDGVITLSDDFVLGLASTPRTVFLEANPQPGPPYELALAGFEPGSTHDLHLYATPIGEELPSKRDYVATVGRVTVDERGEGRLTLDVPADAPDVDYCVTTQIEIAMTDPQDDPCVHRAEFVVSAT